MPGSRVFDAARIAARSAVLAVFLLPSPAAAQATVASNAAQVSAPSESDVYSRDAQGNVTVRAVRISEPLVLDGRLDEEIYRTIPHLGPFIQQEPDEGEPATEPTDVWVFFDDKNLYITARCWDSHPERIVANELGRDARNIFYNDNFVVSLDTFHDRRNGVNFQTNALGGLRDQEITDEWITNEDWNTIWDVRTRIFDKGWTVEFAIPFKSLRYRGGGAQTWGIQLRRVIRWKNETQFLSPVPKSYGSFGAYKFSSAATLIGLELPSGRPPFEVKPYGIAAMTDQRVASAVARNRIRDAGFDLKYGLTKGLTADFTYNTDFAQVEADDQQINLTRFSLFFPEKREFFLEGQGIFQFGPSAPRTNFFGGADLTPVMFFSRRIGLNEGREVPIVAGGRVTGRAGRYTLGALRIRSGDEPAAHAVTTDFTALRFRRDILRRSAIGVLATDRTPQVAGGGSNQLFGADAVMAFFDNLLVNAYYARTHTPGERRDQASYIGKLLWSADRYGVDAGHLYVGDGFNPELGFLRRERFRRTYTVGRFSPRPANGGPVRKYFYEGSIDYLTDTRNNPESRDRGAAFRVDFNNGDHFDLEFGDSYEVLHVPFAIARGVTIAPGGYGFREVRTKYELGPQRHVTGVLSMSSGSFYDGTKREVGYNGRVEVTPRFTVQPRVAIDWVDLGAGEFTTKLASTRIAYAFSARMALSALLQYTSASQTLSSNIRWRWEYRPGSDLFVVYSDGRDTVTRTGVPTLQNRTLALKLTRLLRF